MARNKLLKLARLVCLAALAIPGASLADQEADETDDGLRDCISTNRIRSTRVVDDLNILFYMRGNTVYHNRLPRRCPGLRREERFSYRVSTGRLCQIDLIYVLNSGVTGLDRGPSCRLGYFMEVTEEDAEGIIEGLQRPTEVRPLPPAEPEDVIKEPEES